MTAKLYLIGATPDVFKGLSVKSVELLLKIDERGKVASAEMVTPLRAVDRAGFLKAAEEWLFLPAVENGAPRTPEVKFPLSL